MFSDARIDALGEGRRMSFASRASGRAKLKWNSSALFVRKSLALVAQLDRAPDFESGGRGFESLRARHFGTELGTPNIADFALEAATSVRRSTLFEPMMRTSFASTSTRWASARRWSRRYPPDSVRMRLRAWLAKVFSAC